MIDQSNIGEKNRLLVKQWTIFPFAYDQNNQVVRLRSLHLFPQMASAFPFPLTAVLIMILNIKMNDFYDDWVQGYRNYRFWRVCFDETMDFLHRHRSGMNNIKLDISQLYLSHMITHRNNKICTNSFPCMLHRRRVSLFNNYGIVNFSSLVYSFHLKLKSLDKMAWKMQSEAGNCFNGYYFRCSEMGALFLCNFFFVWYIISDRELSNLNLEISFFKKI